MLAGLARDGGLYVPEFWPVFAPEQIAALAGLPYAELALEILRPFVDDAIPEGDLARMTREAYGAFRHPAVAPLVQLGPRTFVLELFHGPTLAFKDLAMQLLARLMDHVLRQRGERATVICATSGDTGGAAVACGSRPSIPSTGRGSWRRWSIISPPHSRSARRRAGRPSRCRPAISATCSPATWPGAWGCRSIASSSPPTSTIFWCARSKPAPTNCAT